LGPDPPCVVHPHPPAKRSQPSRIQLAQRLLLADTPVILPFFFRWTQAASKRVNGFVPAAIGTQYLSKTWLA